MPRICEAVGGLIAAAARWPAGRLAWTLVIFSIVVVCCSTAIAAQTRRPTNRPTAPRAARHAPLKALFEPVSYPYDVDISDVFFVDAETGWACGHHRTDVGEGGFIIATHDGGKTWSVQFGDRNSPSHAFTRLFFLDATHGWAAQVDGTLLRTTDGARWTTISRINPMSPIVFISPEKGFFLEHGQGIHTTMDGGRTWRLGSICEPVAIAFAPDNSTGYAVARGFDNLTATVLKTTDGGERWTPTSVIRNTDVNDVSLAFSDSSTGYLRAAAAVKMTSDGGRTWHAVPAAVPYDSSKILVADSVGWMVGSHEFSYTLDGGTRWTRRRVEFPARVMTSTLPRSNTGYVAGAHGMIYRYRVVPFDFAVPGMLVIPGMTTFAPGGESSHRQ